jgi:hypothetical protein
MGPCIYSTTGKCAASGEGALACSNYLGDNCKGNKKDKKK